MKAYLRGISSKIDRVRYFEVELPLYKPYGGSANPLTSLRTVLAEVTLDGGLAGWGEAAIYTGYTHETLDGAKGFWREIAEQIVGLTPAEALGKLERHHSEFPFAVSAVATGIEMAADHPVLRPPKTWERVRLLEPLYSKEDAAIADEIDALVEQGYRTIKIKIGLDVDDDLRRVASAQQASQGRVALRIDANQKYSTEDAIRFVSSVDPIDIELVEQTCAAGDWYAAQQVHQASNVPLMLDESIYDLADVDRAAELGAADIVKLKLMKLSSIDALIDGMAHAASLGLKTVLGNGVASAIGCWMEACVARLMLNNDGEMNGFLKPKVDVLVEPLPFEDGCIVLGEGYVPDVNLSVLEQHSTWSHDSHRKRVA